jgi:hypothetical protein
MAVRIQLRRDTAANWTSSNPVLRSGEIGIETDTLKIKVGNGTSTWTQITTYANVTPSGLSSSLGNYILSADQGNPGGPAELDSNGDLIVPENSVILWNDDVYTYSTTLTATEPTANRTITFKNADGTVAFTSDIPSSTDTLSEGSTNKYFTDERAQDAISTALAAGTHTNITVTYNDESNSISLAAAPGYVDEQAVDAVAAALAAGTHTNITVGYNDNANSISLTGAVTYTDENAQDAVGNAVGTGLSYNDTTGAISVDTSTIQARVTDVSDTEIGYLNGVTSAIQTQINTKAPLASPSFTGGIYVTGNTTLEGDLTVTGTTTTVNTINTAIADNMIYLNEGIHYDISNASGNGTNQTYTTVLAHDITAGMFIRVTGITPSGYNLASFVEVLSVGNKTITVAGTFTGTYTSGGELTSKGSTNPDLGFAGGYNDGTYHHAGLFRDASDGSWKFFQGYDPEPDGLFINTADASFALAPLKVAAFEAASATIGDVSNTELQYLNGVTSAIQTQLDDKSTASKTETFTNKTLTSPKINEDVALTATATELNYVDGVTSAIQTQLDAKVDESIITAKGDLYVGSASATLDNLAVGSNGYLLTADSAEPLGVKWAAAPVSLPDQTGNSGEYLTTDGTTASWAAIPVTSAASPSSAGTVLGLTSTSSDNTALGHGPLTSLTTGVYNTGVGKNALLALTSGVANTALGLGALKSNTSGSDNTALGLEALWANLNGQYNVAVGRNAMQLNSSGAGNVVIGYQSLYRNTSGNSNTVVGSQAAGYITGSNNTILGAVAAYTGTNDITTGSNNILVGYRAAATSAGVSNEATIGDENINRFRIPGIGLDFGKTSTVSSNSATTIDSIALTSFTSAEYLLSLKQGSKIRTSKVIVQDDGTNVDMTEFAITETGGTMSGVVVSAAASSGNAVLQLTVTDAATTNVTVKLSKVVL